MNHCIKLGLFTAFLSSLVSVAVAEEPTLRQWARERVNQGLLNPLAEKEAERGKFSRARLPPRERRLKVLSGTLAKDTKGRGFVRYRVDVRYVEEWATDIEGCVYRESGEIFVQVGEEYRPAAFLLGKHVKSVPNACEVAPPPQS